jgi:hypothetical protein
VNPYVVPDAELNNSTEFRQLSGYATGSTSTLNSRTDVDGPGVHFDMTLSGASNGKMALGDPWPTSSNAGLGWDPVLNHYTSLSSYGSYQMVIRYETGPVGSDLNISLIMNTGLTGVSGYPSSDATNDTFWAGSWVTIGVGETKTLTLDFSSAEAWNISDNKDPHTGGGLGLTNGGWYAINDRDLNEITNIGLQIADFDGDALGRSVTLHLNEQAVPAPAGFALLSLGSGLVVLIRRLRRRLNRTAVDRG